MWVLICWANHLGLSLQECRMLDLVEKFLKKMFWSKISIDWFDMSRSKKNNGWKWNSLSITFHKLFLILLETCMYYYVCSHSFHFKLRKPIVQIANCSNSKSRKILLYSRKTSFGFSTPLLLLVRSPAWLQTFSSWLEIISNINLNNFFFL